MRREIERKLIHALGITAILPIAYLGSSVAVMLVLAVLVGFILLAVIRGRFKILRGFERLIARYERRGEFPLKGAIMFYLGSLASIVLFAPQIAIASIAVLSISDSIATLVGSLHGKHKIFFNRKSSLEGSLAFFMTALPIILLFATPWKALIAVFLVTIIEALPRIDDNITIPLATGLLLTFL